jgi:hypothetical protein
MEEHKTIQKIMAAQGTVEEGTDGRDIALGMGRASENERDVTGRDCKATGWLVGLLLFDYCLSCG